MLENITYGTYILFGVLTTLGAGFIWFFVPETKRLSLEEMVRDNLILGNKISVLTVPARTSSLALRELLKRIPSEWTRSTRRLASTPFFAVTLPCLPMTVVIWRRTWRPPPLTLKTLETGCLCRRTYDYTVKQMKKQAPRWEIRRSLSRGHRYPNQMLRSFSFLLLQGSIHNVRGLADIRH